MRTPEATLGCSMGYKKTIVFAHAVVLAALPIAGVAADEGLVATSTKPATSPVDAVTAALGEPVLQPFAPITGGETYDSDDTYFTDVNLSLKIRLSPANLLPQIRPFLAMSTRFGFYWGSRSGSPVIGKSYNPELFFRFLPHGTVLPGYNDQHFEYPQFFNIGYAHESNGQLVHTQQQYQQQLLNTPPASYADNFIHRGWDYADFAWKDALLTDAATSYLELKYFLPHGLLQGPEDQYHSWENDPQGKPRKAVDGIEETFAWPRRDAHFVDEKHVGFGHLNLTLKYATGYQDPFRYSTLRGELGFQLYSLPLAVWAQRGYMSSLANYYRDADSVGVELRFETFD
jgi:hypothetical protein